MAPHCAYYNWTLNSSQHWWLYTVLITIKPSTFGKILDQSLISDITGGSRGMPSIHPLRVQILSFRHTKFSKHNCLRRQCAPHEVHALYGKSWIRHCCDPNFLNLNPHEIINLERIIIIFLMFNKSMYKYLRLCVWKRVSEAVADPGFPVGGAWIPDAVTFQIFCMSKRRILDP